MCSSKLNPESGFTDYDSDCDSNGKMFPIIPRMSSVFMQLTSLAFSLFFFALIVVLLHQYHMDNEHRLPALYNLTNSSSETININDTITISPMFVTTLITSNQTH